MASSSSSSAVVYPWQYSAWTLLRHHLEGCAFADRARGRIGRRHGGQLGPPSVDLRDCECHRLLPFVIVPSVIWRELLAVTPLVERERGGHGVRCLCGTATAAVFPAVVLAVRKAVPFAGSPRCLRLGIAGVDQGRGELA